MINLLKTFLVLILGFTVAYLGTGSAVRFVDLFICPTLRCRDPLLVLIPSMTLCRAVLFCPETRLCGHACTTATLLPESPLTLIPPLTIRLTCQFTLIFSQLNRLSVTRDNACCNYLVIATVRLCPASE